MKKKYKDGIDHSNFHGKKGRSGRKSMYKEKESAEILRRAFAVGVDMEKLKGLPQQKRIRLIDWYIMQAFKSNSILSSAANKVLPDKINLDGKFNINFSEEADKRAKKYD